MARSLPDLPAELLLKIIEYQPIQKGPDVFEMPNVMKERKDVYKAHRACCRELNAKLVYHFGRNHFREIRISVDKAGLSLFHAVSQGHLSAHLRSAELALDPLLAYDSRESDCNRPMLSRTQTLGMHCESKINMRSGDGASASTKMSSILRPAANVARCSRLRFPVSQTLLQSPYVRQTS